jgi:hypothetical protein
MRRIGGYIILSVVLVIGGIYMYSAFSKRNVYINSFEVSDNLAKQGITGIRVANQILDKVAVIRETKLDRYKKEYLNLLIVSDSKNPYKILKFRVTLSSAKTRERRKCYGIKTI